MSPIKFIERRFGEPTSVQKQAVPVIASGKHVLVVASTGEGKTEAAVVPLLSSPEDGKGVRIVYVTPLRALNRDMTKRLSGLGKEFGVTVAVRHGDTTQYERAKQLKRPPYLMVTTPESLAAMLSAEKMAGNFSGVTHVIVDEAHELYSSKRGSMLAVLLERLARRAGEFQRILLSATVPDPGALARFFFGRREYVLVSPENAKRPLLSVELPEPNKADRLLAKALNTQPEVMARVRRILESDGSFICFTNTRSTAELLSSRIKAVSGKVGVHHSSLGKEERTAAEHELKSGKVKGVIATSSLELGIDVGRVEEVIQYSSPRQASRLVQRTGRSGHARGRTPKGTVIALDEFDALESAVICELALENRLEKQSWLDKPYDVAAIQSAGMCVEPGGPANAEAMLSVLKGTTAYQNMGAEEYSRVLNQMESAGIIRENDNKVYKTLRTRKYYYENISVIPDTRKFRVREASTGRIIAVLDEAFVESELYDKNVFIVKGRPWKVLEVSDREVVVEPRTDYSAVIPAWEGENIPVSSQVAERVRQVLAGERRVPDLIKQKERVSRLVREQAACFTPEKNVVWVEQVEEFIVIHSFLGTRANNALGKYLGFLASETQGSAVAVSAGAYHVALQGTGPGTVKKILLGKPALDTVLRKAVLKTGAYHQKLLHVAKRFGLIGKNSRIKSMKRFALALSGTVVEEEAVKELLSEKYDTGTAAEALSKTHSGKAKVKEYAGKPSPLANRVFSVELRIPDLILPTRPIQQIIESVRKAVQEKTVLLYCTYCRKPFYRKVSDLPEKIACPYCGSTQVALVKRENLFPALEKRNKTPEEKQFMKEVLDTVPVIDSYGKRGAQALLMRGIGPDTAKRVLARNRLSEKRFWADLLEAQRNYYKNRQYWE